MVKGIEGAKLGRVRVGSYVGFCHRGRRKNFNIAAIDSREDFLSRARERAIDIPDDSDGFYFFDIFTAKIILPNGRVILVEEKMIRSDVYYYEGIIVDSSHVKTRLGRVETLMREGDQII